MKRLILIPLCLLTFTIAASAQKEKKAPPPPPPPPPTTEVILVENSLEPPPPPPPPPIQAPPPPVPPQVPAPTKDIKSEQTTEFYKRNPTVKGIAWTKGRWLTIFNKNNTTEVFDMKDSVVIKKVNAKYGQMPLVMKTEE